MKVSAPALAFALCAVARSVYGATGPGPVRSLIVALEAPHRLQPRMLLAEREDPAHPVAAAATDPNEAAMRIKPQDLVPTDRPGAHPDYHHPRRPSRDSDGDDDDGGSSRLGPGTKGSNSSSKQRAKDSERGGGNGKDQQPKGKDGKGPSKDSKGPSKGGKDKKTHTGLDGNEVDDEDSDDMDAARKKSQQVKHVQARQRKWRTGKPKYNYAQAIEGWKEVGPMYYYKGKYANTAASRHLLTHSAAAAAVPLVCALLLY
ncbi:hypothetical protein LPJ61_002067 [Coemansia biformis]|uniref:Uncharacterized protein n=1 Tax=Coemansia biformis TaxID=1286918 RepID=A0A9W7YF86_9FUNG|nr:hypothetical protein LPJ61_002067 [Coemansia biformis]